MAPQGYRHEVFRPEHSGRNAPGFEAAQHFQSPLHAIHHTTTTSRMQRHDSSQISMSDIIFALQEKLADQLQHILPFRVGNRPAATRAILLPGVGKTEADAQLQGQGDAEDARGFGGPPR